MGGCPSGVGGRPSRGVECSVPGTHGCQAHLFRTTRLLMKLAPKREAGWLGFFRGGVLLGLYVDQLAYFVISYYTKDSTT